MKFTECNNVKDDVLTIEEIKKELDAGKKVIAELEDPDRLRGFGISELFIQEWINNDVSIREYNPIYFITSNGVAIHHNDLISYFRIKRPSPTFDDVVKLASQAYIDGVVEVLELTDKRIVINGRIAANKKGRAFDVAINKINSLYTETFVMEDVSSFSKITEGIQSIVLANGCDITHRVYFDDSSLRLRDGWGDSITLTFEILKGATVTQKKHNHGIIQEDN